VGKKPNSTGIAVLVFLVVIVAITTIRLTGLGKEFPNPVGSAMEKVLAPVESVIWKMGDGFRGNIRAIFSFNKVKAENEALQSQVDKLVGDNIKLKQQVLAALRYDELDEGIFDSPTLDKYKQMGASIINRDTTAWYQTITVNKGSKDGVKINDPVVAYVGLVGKVVLVAETTSDVLLILDGEGQVGAIARDSHGHAVFGVLHGTYQRGTRLDSQVALEMNLKREDEVNIGDLVLTSGLGGVYPKEIPIGVVEKTQLDSTGLIKVAYIKPIVNFDSLEEVFLVDMAGGN